MFVLLIITTPSLLLTLLSLHWLSLSICCLGEFTHCSNVSVFALILCNSCKSTVVISQFQKTVSQTATLLHHYCNMWIHPFFYSTLFVFLYLHSFLTPVSTDYVFIIKISSIYFRQVVFSDIILERAAYTWY